jgi:16S rRNA G966 N2-methylase RsmD
MISPETVSFIQAHIHDNAQRLLLSAHRYPHIDMRFVAQQISARQKIKEKLPQWYAHPKVVFPSSLACEQASSMTTARYKERFVGKGACLIDATGGLGVDSSACAASASQVVYIEKDRGIFQAAEHNFATIGLQNIKVLQGSSLDLIPTLPPADIVYIDPSRRGTDQKRLFALSDCEPNIVVVKELLIEKALKVLVKLSPMADIAQTLRHLPETVEVHIVSVKNECRELLFLLKKQDDFQADIHTIPIRCVNLCGDDTESEATQFCFTLGEEREATPSIAENNPHGYLYEPNTSILKGGAFKLIAQRYGVQKVHLHTHLYHSPTLLAAFPGRIFKIKEIVEFNKHTINTLHHSIPQANIAVRNFCMEAVELRKRIKIGEGGDVYIFGVKVYSNRYVLIITHKEK